MKKLMLKDGTTLETGEEYGLRLIEQGEAVGFAPEEKAEAPKAEPKAEMPEAAEPAKKEAPKKGK